jgi:hypothetical protein
MPHLVEINGSCSQCGGTGLVDYVPPPTAYMDPNVWDQQFVCSCVRFVDFKDVSDAAPE